MPHETRVTRLVHVIAAFCVAGPCICIGLFHPYVSHDLFKSAPQLILIYVT